MFERGFIATLNRNYTAEIITGRVPAEKIDDRDADYDLEHIQRENKDLNKDVERGSSTIEKVNNVEEEALEPRDPNLVDWDGPDDPENPLNWTTGRKAMMTTSIALITFLTYVIVDLTD